VGLYYSGLSERTYLYYEIEGMGLKKKKKKENRVLKLERIELRNQKRNNLLNIFSD
jgi:hypothetical protein